MITNGPETASRQVLRGPEPLDPEEGLSGNGVLASNGIDGQQASGTSEIPGSLLPEGLLGRLLTDQQQLTAVEYFSREHKSGQLPHQAKYYSRLMPTAPPGPGQQYAFEVDLDRCTGCKACVTACHALNGLDDCETWRDVGLLVGGTSANPVMQHVTTACHHCLEPACLTACPVDAYQKDPHTGIVKHLDDQCFGCQYCVLACPYDVPKYQPERGIVRKCDLCSDRLQAGEAPACVQACPNEAISIQVVTITQVYENAEADPFLPAAPEPHLTFPTTSYRTSRTFPRNLLPADYYAVSPQHPHWPLIVMLVLTQLSVGAFLVGLGIEHLHDSTAVASFRFLQSSSALTFGLLALAASVFHLGRPWLAFRAIIGVRHSWLSREILAFGLFAASAILFATTNWLPQTFPGWSQILCWVVAATGCLGVYCSGMIYIFTQREFWNFGRTMSRFVLTTLLLGIGTTWLTLTTLGITSASSSGAASPTDEVVYLIRSVGPSLAIGLMTVTGFKLLLEGSLLGHLGSRRNSPLRRSARLMVGPLSNVTLARFACGILGGLAMPAFLLTSNVAENPASDPTVLVTVCLLFAASLAGELLERYLFFAAVSSPRMPGGLRT